MHTQILNDLFYVLKYALDHYLILLMRYSMDLILLSMMSIIERFELPIEAVELKIYKWIQMGWAEKT